MRQIRVVAFQLVQQFRICCISQPVFACRRGFSYVEIVIGKEKPAVTQAPDTFFDDDHYRGYRAVLVSCPLSRPTNWTACCAGPAIFSRRGKKRKR